MGVDGSALTARRVACAGSLPARVVAFVAQVKVQPEGERRRVERQHSRLRVDVLQWPWIVRRTLDDKNSKLSLGSHQPLAKSREPWAKLADFVASRPAFSFPDC